MQNTEISYYLEFPGNVNMEILDPFGHFICNRQIGFQTKGNQTFSLDCSALTPGVYWYSIAVGNKREWQKMIKIE